MNNQETLNKMKSMHLLGMHRAFTLCVEQGKTENYTPDELTAFLIWILRSKFTTVSPQSLPLKRICCC